ncbi:MAG: hypothetical protein HQL34_13405, partial [Alphaproteobacteria bacterium]|nr:hypothetical protein [Alphaproteobacteria bacterium]
GVLPSVCVLDVTEDPDEVVAGVRSGTGPTAIVLPLWRAVPVGDVEARRALRTSACPPGRHDEAPVEMDVARRLLSDHALYARALSLFQQVAESY